MKVWPEKVYTAGIGEVPDLPPSFLKQSRPGWDEYFLGIAEAVAKRADCTRLKVGAVIVKQHRIVSTGYNGAPAGAPGCLEGACLRGQHWLKYPDDEDVGGIGICACGDLWPCAYAVSHGSQYEHGAGECIAVHAEANALLYADRDHCEGATLYCTVEPCQACKKLIRGAGIREIVYPDGNGGYYKGMG